MSNELLDSKLPQHFTFSQSSLQDFFDCPRRFQLRYIEQMAWPAIDTEPMQENEQRQQEGQLFHHLVQQHIVGLPEGRLVCFVNTSNLERWWKNYLGSELGVSGYAQFTEPTLVTRIGDHRLLAKYDLIAIEPGKRAIIFDWKTYRHRPKDEWMAARMQTRVYRALLVRAGAHLNGGIPFQPEQVQMTYWYADFPTEPARFAYTAAQYKRDWDALTGMVQDISRHGHFPLTEDEKKCDYCRYRSYCNRGGKAGTLDESEFESEANTAEFNLNFEQIGEIEF